MTDDTFKTLLISIPVILASLGAFINSLRNTGKIANVQADVTKVQKQTDGMHAELKEANARADKSEGIQEGIEAERARPIDQPIDTIVKG